jgi:hypothetical protein
MSKTRKNKNNKYYSICKPTTKNKHTGNFCINTKYILAYDKDFLYDYDGEIKLISREYVKNHMTTKPFTRLIEDEETLSTKRCFYECYFITYQDVLNAPDLFMVEAA